MKASVRVTSPHNLVEVRSRLVYWPGSHGNFVVVCIDIYVAV